MWRDREKSLEAKLISYLPWSSLKKEILDIGHLCPKRSTLSTPGSWSGIWHVRESPFPEQFKWPARNLDKRKNGIFGKNLMNILDFTTLSTLTLAEIHPVYDLNVFSQYLAMAEEAFRLVGERVWYTAPVQGHLKVRLAYGIEAQGRQDNQVVISKKINVMVV